MTDSGLTSSGPVSEGSTRYCDFAPFGGVSERIDRHEPNQRLTVNLYETFKLPISGAVADLNIASLLALAAGCGFLLARWWLRRAKLTISLRARMCSYPGSTLG